MNVLWVGIVIVAVAVSVAGTDEDDQIQTAMFDCSNKTKVAMGDVMTMFGQSENEISEVAKWTVEAKEFIKCFYGSIGVISPPPANKLVMSKFTEMGSGGADDGDVKINPENYPFMKGPFATPDDVADFHVHIMKLVKENEAKEAKPADA